MLTTIVTTGGTTLGYMIRQMTDDRTLCQALTVDALHAAVPAATIQTILTTQGAQAHRERKFTMTAVVWVLIAMNLYTAVPISAVIRTLLKSLRLLMPGTAPTVPTDSAFSYRRYQLGARPIVALFHAVCQPMTTPTTPGAFRFGLRLVALDGTVEDVADTPANVRAFGRTGSQRGPSAFPQVRGVYLIECGSHAILDAGFWPVRTNERVGGVRLLRALTPEMLILWDRGFHDARMIQAVQRRGAQVLGRLPATVKPHRLQTLPDGSYLAHLQPPKAPRGPAAMTGRMKKQHLTLTTDDRTYLETLLATGTLPVKTMRRATAWLELDRGKTFAAVASTLGVSTPTIAAWRARYQQLGVAGVLEVPRSGRPITIDDTQRAKITALACSTAPEGHARWSLRLLAEKVVDAGFCDEISHTTIATILKKTP